MLLTVGDVGSVQMGKGVWSGNPWELPQGVLSGNEEPSWVGRGLPWVNLGGFGV